METRGKLSDKGLNQDLNQHGGKAPYSTPRLVAYGSVAAVTGSSDACSGFDRMSVNLGPRPDRMTGVCPI